MEALQDLQFPFLSQLLLQFLDGREEVAHFLNADESSIGAEFE
jgi:hypothetical protein